MTLNITSIYMLVTIASSVLIIIGSIKLYKTQNIPGSKLIFFSIIGYILTIFIPDSEMVDEQYIFTTKIAEVTTGSILMLMSAYGFYLLASYIAINNANK